MNACTSGSGLELVESVERHLSTLGYTSPVLNSIQACLTIEYIEKGDIQRAESRIPILDESVQSNVIDKMLLAYKSLDEKLDFCQSCSSVLSDTAIDSLFKSTQHDVNGIIKGLSCLKQSPSVSL